jgi:hypothetical protein
VERLAGLPVEHAVDLFGGDPPGFHLRGEDVANQLVLAGSGLPERDAEQGEPDDGREDDDDGRQVPEGRGVVPAEVQEHAGQDEADAALDPAGLGDGADQVHEAAAHQRAEQRVRDEAGGDPDTRRQHGVADRFGAESRRRGVGGIGPVLEHGEAQPDEGADDQTVVGGADQPRGQAHEQQEAAELGRLLGEGRGEPGPPVGGPALTEELGIGLDERVVGCRGDAERRRGGSPEQAGEDEAQGLAFPPVDVPEPQPPRQPGQAAQDGGDRVRLTVEADLRLHPRHDVEGAEPGEGHVHPEAQVVRLDEGEPLSPARHLQRLGLPPLRVRGAGVDHGVGRLAAHSASPWARMLVIMAVMSSAVAAIWAGGP